LNEVTMSTLHVNNAGNGAAAVKGQQQVKDQHPAPKSDTPDSKPGGHVCTNACTHDGAVKGKPAPTAAKV
jgi:hypothetical protein